MKKVYYFVILCMYVLGVIGGIGYAAYNGAWPISVGVAATGFMAYFKAREYFQKLTN